MPRCLCGLQLVFCPGCGLGVETDEGLLRTVGDFPLSLGTFAGKTVKQVAAEPGAIEKFGRRPASKGPPQGKLLRCYARASVANQELLYAAQEANVFATVDTPRGAPRVWPEFVIGGDTGGSGEPASGDSKLSCPFGFKDVSASWRRTSGRCRKIFKKFIQLFPVHKWLKYILGPSLDLFLAFAPIVTILSLGFLMFPRATGRWFILAMVYLVELLCKALFFLAAGFGDVYGEALYVVASETSSWATTTAEEITSEAATEIAEDLNPASACATVLTILTAIVIHTLGLHGGAAAGGAIVPAAGGVVAAVV
jgi:hypothetical protein